MRRDEGKKAFLEHLIKTPIIQVACTKANIGRTTVYRWRKEDTEFAFAMDATLQEGYEFVSDIAESQLISLIKKGNFNAVAYWLKHNRNRYGTKVELSGSIDVREELTEEELAIVRQAISHVIGLSKSHHDNASKPSGDTTQSDKQ
jgi:hypothetical protein